MNKTVKEYLDILKNNLNAKERITDEIFHNTQLMLELYSKVLIRTSKRLYIIDEECYETENKHLYEFVTTLLDIDTQLRMEKFESRLRSLEESAGILNLMDKTLFMFKENGERNEIYYNILFYCYFQKNKYTNQKVMDILDIPSTTFFRYKKFAIKEFAVNLWGFTIPELKRSTEVILNVYKKSDVEVNW